MVRGKESKIREKLSLWGKRGKQGEEEKFPTLSFKCYILILSYSKCNKYKIWNIFF